MFSFVAHSRAAWFLKQCQGGMNWARQSWGHRAVPKQMAQQTLGQLWAPRVEDSALCKRGRKTRNNSSVPSTGWGPAPDLGKTLRVKSGISPSCWEQGHQRDNDPPTVTPAQTLMSSRLQSLPWAKFIPSPGRIHLLTTLELFIKAQTPQ